MVVSAAGDRVLKPMGTVAFVISQGEGSREQVSAIVAPGQSEGWPWGESKRRSERRESTDPK